MVWLSKWIKQHTDIILISNEWSNIGRGHNMSKILIVDDEKSIRSTFEIFLAKEGHEVF